MDAISSLGNRMFAQDDDGGAMPTLYAALAEIPGNSYAGPGGLMQTRGAPKLVGRSSAAMDIDVARRLWDVSEQLTGARLPAGVGRRRELKAAAVDGGAPGYRFAPAHANGAEIEPCRPTTRRC